MVAPLQHRHNTTAVRTAYTPAVSELFYDTTLNEMFVGDGSTAGGVPFSAATALATLSDVDLTSPANHDFLLYLTGTSKWTNETPTFATGLLDDFVGDSGSGGTKGLVPAPASGDAAAGKFLKADGTFQVPSGGGGGLSTTLTSSHIYVGNGSNVATDVAVSGDLGLANTGAYTIVTHAVTNSKMAQMGAHTFKGNNTGSTADPSDLTAAQLTAELDVVVGDTGSGGTKGLVPAPAAGDAAAQKYLKADGTYSTPSGSGLSTTLTSAHFYLGNGSNVAIDVAASGDLTLANTGAFTIANNAVTNAKAAQMGAHTFKGNNTGSTANSLDLTAAQLFSELFSITSIADDDILVYDNASSSWKNRRPKYTIGASIAGVLTASQQLLYHRFAKAVTIPANFGAYLGLTSQAGGTVNATASTVINVDKAPTATPNTFSNVGTITIASSSVTPTFASAGGTAISFAAGDVVRIMGPASPDTTFAGFYGTIVGFET